jgi:hypothetical protein
MIVRPVFALIVHPEFPIPKLPVLDPPFFDVFDQPMAVDPDAYRLWELQYKLAYRAAINRRNVALAEQAVLTKALAWHDKRGLSAWLGGADPEELELHAAVKSLRRCLQ